MSRPRPEVIAAWQKHRADLVTVVAQGEGPARVREITGLSTGDAKALYQAIFRQRQWLYAADVIGAKPPEDADTWEVQQTGQIHTLAQLVESAEIDLNKWDVKTWRANVWHQYSDKSGVTPLWQVRATLERKVLSDVDRPPPVPNAREIRARLDIPRRPARIAVVLPDTQHGFRWNENYTALEPMHDPWAIDAARQLCALLQPDEIVLLGDHLDLAEYGTYRKSRDVRQTTQPSLMALHWDLHALRAMCPRSRIFYLEGNHDNRIRRHTQDSASPIESLRRVGENQEVISVPYLLRLDELGIEYVGPYGADLFFLEKSARAMHGHATGKRVHTQIDSLSRTLFQGHDHRRVIATRQIHDDPAGRRIVRAVSPGCLCRIDSGAVPGAVHQQDWQQGLAVTALVDGHLHVALVEIDRGALMWGGVVIRGRDHSKAIAEFAGYPQIARHSYRIPEGGT